MNPCHDRLAAVPGRLTGNHCAMWLASRRTIRKYVHRSL
jgi:hypothetical protein